MEKNGNKLSHDELGILITALCTRKLELEDISSKITDGDIMWYYAKELVNVQELLVKLRFMEVEY